MALTFTSLLVFALIVFGAVNFFFLQKIYKRPLILEKKIGELENSLLAISYDNYCAIKEVEILVENISSPRISCHCVVYKNCRKKIRKSHLTNNKKNK